jgi:hypothetical protein
MPHPEPVPFGAETPREGKAQDRSRARALCSKPPVQWEGLKRMAFLRIAIRLSYCWSMMFSENRYPLFGIMLWPGLISPGRNR